MKNENLDYAAIDYENCPSGIDLPSRWCDLIKWIVARKTEKGEIPTWLLRGVCAIRKVAFEKDV